MCCFVVGRVLVVVCHSGWLLLFAVVSRLLVFVVCRCLWFVAVCCSLIAVRWLLLLFVVVVWRRRPLFVVRCLLFVVCCLLFAVVC